MTTQTLDTAVLQAILSKDAAVTGRKTTTKGVLPTPPIPEGKVKFSVAFKVKPNSGIEHAITVYKDTDWDEKVRGFIPDIDPGFVPPAKELEMAALAIENNDKLFLHGPMGAGKSSLPRWICGMIRMPFIRVNGRADMESSALFGGIDPATMLWVDGPAGELGTYGGLLCVDEISAVPAGINLAMQYMLEDNGRIYLADKPGRSEDKLIVPEPRFRVCATDNTQMQGDTLGRYAGTMVQNAAMLDRFGTVIELGYLSKAHELEILGHRCPGLSPAVAGLMVQFARVVRDAFEKGAIQFTMSPRALITWGNKATYWGNTQRAFYFSFYSKLIESDRKQVAEMYHKVFAKQVTDFGYDTP